MATAIFQKTPLKTWVLRTNMRTTERITV